VKPHGSVRVVRMWCRICIDPVLRCFDDSEGLNYENLLVSVVPECHSFMTGFEPRGAHRCEEQWNAGDVRV
jgi:hypothetical protein